MTVNHSPVGAHGDAKTVSLIVTMTIKPEHEQEFVAYATEFCKRVHAEEPGALTYVLTKHPTEPNTYTWIERYRDQDALALHSSAPQVDDAKQKLGLWLAKAPILMRYEQVAPK